MTILLRNSESHLKNEISYKKNVYREGDGYLIFSCGQAAL